jgi:hypothetical protein
LRRWPVGSSGADAYVAKTSLDVSDRIVLRSTLLPSGAPSIDLMLIFFASCLQKLIWHM